MVKKSTLWKTTLFTLPGFSLTFINGSSSDRFLNLLIFMQEETFLSVYSITSKRSQKIWCWKLLALPLMNNIQYKGELKMLFFSCKLYSFVPSSTFYPDLLEKLGIFSSNNRKWQKKLSCFHSLKQKSQAIVIRPNFSFKKFYMQ